MGSGSGSCTTLVVAGLRTVLCNTSCEGSNGFNGFVQVIEENVTRTLNSHATMMREGRKHAVEATGLTRRNMKRQAEPFASSNSSWVNFVEA